MKNRLSHNAQHRAQQPVAPTRAQWRLRAVRKSAPKPEGYANVRNILSQVLDFFYFSLPWYIRKRLYHKF